MDYLALPIIFGIKIGGNYGFMLFIIRCKRPRLKTWHKGVLGFIIACWATSLLALYVYALTNIISTLDRFPFAVITFSISILSGVGVYYFEKWLFNSRWGKTMTIKARARRIRRSIERRASSIPV